ncbi:MAG: hypothetical protein ABL958_08625 [Bdellovibrionia bacterium]
MPFNLTVVGLGNMGTSVMVAALKAGFRVRGVDKDPLKTAQLERGETLTHEAGTSDVILNSLKSGRLTIEQDLTALETDLIFIAVETPAQGNGCDYRILLSSLSEIEGIWWPGTPVVIGSTVFPGGFKNEILPRFASSEFSGALAYMPVFLRAGAGTHDFRNPGKVVCGLKSVSTRNTIAKMYAGLFQDPIEPKFVSFEEAEYVKLIHNSFMCLKINFANEMAPFCAPGEFTRIFSEDPSIWTDSWLARGSTEANPDLEALASQLAIGSQTRTAIEERAWSRPHPSFQDGAARTVTAAWAATLSGFFDEFAILIEDVPHDEIMKLSLEENQNGRLRTLSHMKPGAPYSGPCLPKDSEILSGLISRARRKGALKGGVLETISRANERLIDELYQRWSSGQGPLGIVGLSFRPDCPEYRDSLALKVLQRFWRDNPEREIMLFDTHLTGKSAAELKVLARGDQDVLRMFNYLAPSEESVREYADSLILNGRVT